MPKEHEVYIANTHVMERIVNIILPKVKPNVILFCYIIYHNFLYKIVNSFSILFKRSSFLCSDVKDTATHFAFLEAYNC